jgi:hypothetical protein
MFKKVSNDFKKCFINILFSLVFTTVQLEGMNRLISSGALLKEIMVIVSKYDSATLSSSDKNDSPFPYG